MIKIAVAGAAGRMGSSICHLVLKDDTLQMKAAFERKDHAAIGKDIGLALGDSEVGVSIADGPEVCADSDVLIDFTHPTSTVLNASVCAQQKVKMVIGTTGLNTEQGQMIAAASKNTAIVFSPNMAVGVNVLFDIIARALSLLGPDFSVRIEETHHVHKKDSPSGTAKMMAKIMEEEISGPVPVESSRQGEVIGFHRAVYESDMEKLMISHEAKDRSVFAAGALKAAKFVAGKDAGLYDMKDVLGIDKER